MPTGEFNDLNINPIIDAFLNSRILLVCEINNFVHGTIEKSNS